MKTKKIKGYNTAKFCCIQQKSIIEIRKNKEIYSAECVDCGNKIQGKQNVTNLLITTNPIATRHLMNIANQN